MLDGARFLRFARAHFAEQWRPYAWFFAAMFLIWVVGVVALAFQGIRTLDHSTQAAAYYIGLYVLGPIFAGRYFLAMSTRASALISLMRPASVFEKWLLAVLVVAVAWPLAYTLVYYLVDVPASFLAYAAAKQHAAQQAIEFAKAPVGSRPEAFQPENYRLFMPWHEWDNWRDAMAHGLWFLFLQGFAMFGSLYFRAVPFIKSLFAGLMLLLVVALASSFFEGDPDLVLGYWTNKRLLTDTQEVLFPLLWLFVPTAMWLACYLGLREREIAA